MKRKARNLKPVTTRTWKKVLEVSAKLVEPRITPDPEDEPSAEEIGLDIIGGFLIEESQESDPRFGRSSYEEDFSDSLLWEQTFEPFPAWLREAKAEQEAEEAAIVATEEE